MGSPAAFWYGHQLWRYFDWAQPSATMLGGVTHAGARRTFGKRTGDSPNWDREVQLHCWVPRDDTDQGDTTYFLKHTLLMLQLEDALIADSDEARPLSICEDVDRKADVTSGPHAAGAATISHGSAGGSWTPTTGDYVLARNPSTGAGFVAAITGTGAGTVSLVVPAGFSVTSAFDLVDVRLSVAEAWFLRMDGGTPTLDGGPGYRDHVLYAFGHQGNVQYASADAVSRLY